MPAHHSAARLYVREWREWNSDAVTVAQLAKLLGVTVEDYYHLESAPQMLGVARLVILADAFGIHPVQLAYPPGAKINWRDIKWSYTDNGG